MSKAPFVLLGIVLALGGCAARASAPAHPGHASTPREAAVLPGSLPEPPHLAPAVRELLTERMGRHGEVLTYLLASVVYLSYDDVKELALELAEEPKLGHPAPGDTSSANALLPTQFFDLQDRLQVRAGELAAAAERKDPEALSASFSDLTATCVACHAAYLEPPADEEDAP